MKPRLGERFINSDSVFWTIARIVLIFGPLVIALILIFGALTEAPIDLSAKN